MANFKCKERCGDCCCIIAIDPALIEKHKDQFQVSVKQSMKVADGIELHTDDNKCVFLNRRTRQCSIYEDRPKVCQDYGLNGKCPFFDPDGTPKDELRLDLACGNCKRDGFVGVDKVQTSQAEIIHDLNVYPYPWNDDSVDEINCSHFIGQVADIIKFMDECYRILKPNAKMTVSAPYYTSIRAWQDPTHKRTISEATFLYFDKDWRAANKLDHYPVKCNFKGEKMALFFNPPWDKKTDEARQFAAQHYWNVVSDMVAELRVIK